MDNIVKPVYPLSTCLYTCILLRIYKVCLSVYRCRLGAKYSAWHIIGTQHQCTEYFWGSTQPFSLIGIFLSVLAQALLFTACFKRRELTHPSLFLVVVNTDIFMGASASHPIRTLSSNLKRLFLPHTKLKPLPVNLSIQEFPFLYVIV